MEKSSLEVASLYNDIANSYIIFKRNNTWKEKLEKVYILNYLGKLQGKTVLDLACGEGTYSRIMISHGASQVTGVDISEEMIERGKKTESQNPVGHIDYLVGNVIGFRLEGKSYDIVLAIYLFVYAASLEELHSMVKAVSLHLKPGGKLVAITTDSLHDFKKFSGTDDFQYTSKIISSDKSFLGDGEKIEISFSLNVNNTSFKGGFVNHMWTRETLMKVMEEHGLGNFGFYPIPVAENGEFNTYFMILTAEKK